MRAHPDILTRRLDDGAVIVHLGSNVIFELNETAARIWELISEGRDVATVRDQLVEEFDVSAFEAEAATRALVTRLRDAGALLT